MKQSLPNGFGQVWVPPSFQSPRTILHSDKTVLVRMPVCSSNMISEDTNIGNSPTLLYIQYVILIAIGTFSPKMNQNFNYQNNGNPGPNHIPASERATSIIFSSVLLIYGFVGASVDDLYLPGKIRGIHLHGEPMWIMLGAFAFAIANLLSVVIDHYDKRNNETNYRRIANITKIAGWVLFGIAILLDLVVFHKGTLR